MKSYIELFSVSITSFTCVSVVDLVAKHIFVLDIDECLEQRGLCGPVGTCINTMGSYKCLCPRGFKPDQSGTMCVDADECLTDDTCDIGCEVKFNISTSIACILTTDLYHTIINILFVIYEFYSS